jgi:hypothetical protein
VRRAWSFDAEGSSDITTLLGRQSPESVGNGCKWLITRHFLPALSSRPYGHQIEFSEVTQTAWNTQELVGVDDGIVLVVLGVLVEVGAPVVVGAFAVVEAIVVVEVVDVVLDVVLAPVDPVALDVVVVVLAGAVVPCGASGDTQFAGGAVGPTCPGMRTVPAHPKLLKVAATVTDPPSENWYLVIDWTMKPCASTATFVVVADNPWFWSVETAA